MIYVLRLVPAQKNLAEHYEITRWNPTVPKASAFAKGNIETVAETADALYLYIAEFGRPDLAVYAPLKAGSYKRYEPLNDETPISVTLPKKDWDRVIGQATDGDLTDTLQLAMPCDDCSSAPCQCSTTPNCSNAGFGQFVC